MASTGSHEGIKRAKVISAFLLLLFLAALAVSADSSSLSASSTLFEPPSFPSPSDPFFLFEEGSSRSDSGGEAPSPHPQSPHLLNSDIMLNYISATDATFCVFVRKSPNTFDPNEFLSALYEKYQHSPKAEGDGQLMQVAEQLQLVEWCGYPNTTYDKTTSFCGAGAAPYNNADQYVFVRYRILDVPLSNKDLASLDLKDIGVVEAIHLSSTDPSFFNPDSRETLDFNTGFERVIYNNSTAAWVTFGVLFCVAGLFFILLPGYQYWRDTRAHRRYHDALTRALSKIREGLFRAPATSRSYSSSAGNHDEEYRNPAESLAQHYNIPEPNVSGGGGGMEREMDIRVATPPPAAEREN